MSLPVQPPTLQPPTLQYAILCDGVAQPPELGGKLVIIGIFANLIRPSVIPQFFIVTRWIDGLGDHTQRIKLLKPDLSELLKLDEQKFSLPNKVMSADIVSGFVNINFDSSGVYWVQIELDGTAALSFPLPVFTDPTPRS